MPVRKCSNGKYQIGSGDCIYKSKSSAERAYKGYLGAKYSEGFDKEDYIMSNKKELKERKLSSESEDSGDKNSAKDIKRMMKLSGIAKSGESEETSSESRFENAKPKFLFIKELNSKISRKEHLSEDGLINDSNINQYNEDMKFALDIYHELYDPNQAINNSEQHDDDIYNHIIVELVRMGRTAEWAKMIVELVQEHRWEVASGAWDNWSGKGPDFAPHLGEFQGDEYNPARKSYLITLHWDGGSYEKEVLGVESVSHALRIAMHEAGIDRYTPGLEAVVVGDIYNNGDDSEMITVSVDNYFSKFDNMFGRGVVGDSPIPEELKYFKQGSIERLMVEMIIDELKKGLSPSEISEELSINEADVNYICSFITEKRKKQEKVGDKDQDVSEQEETLSECMKYVNRIVELSKTNK